MRLELCRRTDGLLKVALRGGWRESIGRRGVNSDIRWPSAGNFTSCKRFVGGAIAAAGLGWTALLGPDFAEARKFDISQEVVAPYIGGTYGISNLSDSVYGRSSGASTLFTETVKQNMSGELGVTLKLQSVVLRLGVEYIFGQTMTGVKGKNQTGIELLDLDSKVSAIVPMGAVEIPLSMGTESRLHFGIGGGYALVNVDNEYRLTSTGQSTYPGVPETYSEKGSGGGIAYKAYVGGEFLLTDTVTFAVDVGYRQVQATRIQATKAMTTLSGSYPSGADLLFNSGDPRSVNLGGLYFGSQLRIYIPY